MIGFGTGGWRAEIGKDFTMNNVRMVGQALAQRILTEGVQQCPVIIGYDRRFLSLEAARWLAEVLTFHGITVWFMRRSVPTPLVMHTVKKQHLAYGLEVTASHNLPSYNGIKVIVKEGRDAPLECTHALELELDRLDTSKLSFLPFDEAVSQGLVVYLEHPFNDFLDDVLLLLDNAAIRQKGPRILFDTMHGSSTYPLMVILYTNRCTVDLMHNDRDAYFGGMMPAPSETTLCDLRRKVVLGGYDLGIGIDGDGDRLGVIDSNGNYIDANSILCLLYYYLHQYKGWHGPVVRNLATTHLLDRIAESFGEVCYEVPVGFKYISSKIDEVDAVLGGESSGGLTVRGHIHGKDSVYASALFIEMLCVTEKSAGELLSKLHQKFGSFIMETDNLTFNPTDKTRIQQMIIIQRLLPDFGRAVAKTNYQDGCKVYFEDDSFVICRFSGTEPLLRIFAEASDSKTARGYIGAWRQMLKI